MHILTRDMSSLVDFSLSLSAGKSLATLTTEYEAVHCGRGSRKAYLQSNLR